MANDKKILSDIYESLFKRDVDYSINIFLCGADTAVKSSIRNLLNTELQKYAKFNTVFPEYIFANLLGKGEHNLLELEDDLAKYVDVIIIPIEGIGTICELGAFSMNKSLLPKIIAINNSRYKNKHSFINLGPLDLINKKHSKNILYFDDGNEHELITEVVEKVRYKRFSKKFTYDLENIFNLTRFILYLVAVFQPITKKKIKQLIASFSEQVHGQKKVKMKYIDSAIQILIQKNRVDLDINQETLEELYFLSKDGHKYFYQELLEQLSVKKYFSEIRSIIINERYKPIKKDMSKEKLLV